jgi:alpha-1,6-mannosyltransferase
VRGPSLPYDPTYHLLARVDKIRAVVAREEPDVLEVHSPYMAMLAGLSASRAHFGIRTFFWHADFIDTYLRVMIERHAPSRAADVALSPLWTTVRACASACDATFAAGKRQVEKLREHGVPRVEHAPFGVEKRVFTPAARDETRRRELLGGRTGARLLVGVGRFAVEKRWDVVLDAFVEVRDELGVDAVLVLLGDGPEKAAMQARVAGRDDVRFLGFETDRAKLASVLASADALVHGCPYETFGLGVAEAMSCGVPVVVPDEGGASETVSRSSGEIYRSRDAHACARAIVRILARDPGELRAAALASAASILDVDEHYARLLDRYRDLLAARRAR